jgi:hypothetical protein
VKAALSTGPGIRPDHSRCGGRSMPPSLAVPTALLQLLHYCTTALLNDNENGGKYCIKWPGMILCLLVALTAGPRIAREAK